jgi:ribosomal protein L30/L7E
MMRLLNVRAIVRPGAGPAPPSIFYRNIRMDHLNVKWEQVIDSLYKMFLLKNDWDGMGADAPYLDVIASAIELMERVRSRHGWPPPSRAVATSNGSVILEWQTPRKSLDIEIERPGHAEWMLSLGLNRNRQGVGVPDIPRLLDGEEPL